MVDMSRDDHSVSPTCHVRIPVSDSSQVGEARRTAGRLTLEAGFAEEERGKAAIVVSELATNLARYAVDGEILLHALRAGGVLQFDVLAIDRGPGIPDLSRSLADGYSTGGTPGNGLGAVRRLSTEFDIISTPSTGTIVFSRIAAKDSGAAPKQFQWACLSRPAPNEIMCGDSWRIIEHDGRLAIMLVDGLGHGPLAAAAAHEATVAFDREPFAPLATIFEAANGRMGGTRGGAMAIAQVHSKAASLSYLGVGNIAGSLRDVNGEGGRGLVSQNGTVGSHMRKTKEFEYPCASHGFLVMHSDGLQSRWSLEGLPGITQRHCGVIAGHLYRGFTRGRDDVTIAVIRFPVQR